MEITKKIANMVGRDMNWNEEKEALAKLLRTPLSHLEGTEMFQKETSLIVNTQAPLFLRRKAFEKVVEATTMDAFHELQTEGHLSDNSRLALWFLFRAANSEHHLMGDAPMTEVIEFIEVNSITIC